MDECESFWLSQITTAIVSPPFLVPAEDTKSHIFCVHLTLLPPTLPLPLPVIGSIKAQEQIGQDRSPKDVLLNKQTDGVMFIGGSDSKISAGNQGHDHLEDHPEVAEASCLGRRRRRGRRRKRRERKGVIGV